MDNEVEKADAKAATPASERLEGQYLHLRADLLSKHVPY